LQLFYTLVEDFKMKVMNKIAFSFVLLLPTFCCTKQQQTPKVLDQKGNISLLFNQSAYNKQWLGGTSNVAGNFGLNYDFNYKMTLFGIIN
jgi:hypothetical protein